MLSIDATVLTVEDVSSLTGLYGTIKTNFLPTTATVTSVVDIMVCNFASVVILLITMLAMFVAGIAKMTLDTFIWVLSMNISTLTRSNPLSGFPPGGSTVWDSKRLKHLREVRARFGDVQAKEEVGGRVPSQTLRYSHHPPHKLL